MTRFGLFRDVARYAHRAVLFGALPSRGGARFIGAGHMFVSAHENRGRHLRRHVGVLHPLISHTWRRIVKLLQPTVVLDIGANYGEVVFCTRYPPRAEIFIVEPNPRLAPDLERSRAAHRNGDRMRIVQRVAADHNGTVTLTVDEKWSGTSSVIGPANAPPNAFRGTGPERSRQLQVGAITIDSQLADMPADKLHGMAFKVDVEGYEARVLEGMKETLARAGRWLAILEFDGDKLRLAGTPPADTLALMRDLGTVARFGRDGHFVDVESVEALPPHCDLIMASDPALISALAPLPRWLRRYTHAGVPGS